VFPERHVSQVQQPFHFEIVGFRSRYFVKYSMASPRRLFACNGDPDEWENAPLTRMAINVVVHLGFVQVTDPEHFSISGTRGEHPPGRSDRRSPTPRQRGHIAAVGVDLSLVM